MKTLSALLLTGDSNIRPNKNLNEVSANKLQELARSLHRWDRPSIGFTVGMWLSGVWFPERLPVIIIPTLRVMSRLDRLWVHDTSATFYQARDFLIREQWMHPTEAMRISNHMEQYLREYIRRKYPELEERIEFKFDKKIDPEELEDVQSNLQTSNSSDMQKIVAYATSKWRDEESAYIYAAANVVCNLYAWRAHHIVIGWEKERPFFRLWQSLEFARPSSPQSIFLLQSTGSVPPYYPQEWQESYFNKDGIRISGPAILTNKHISYDQSIL